MNDRQDALHRIDAALDTAVAKLDNENKAWVNESPFSDEKKKAITPALNAFEKEIERYFLAQQKEIVAFARSCVGKAVSEDLLSALVDMLSDFLQDNDEEYVSRLSGLYEAFAPPLVSEIAQIACNEVTADKILESLSERATNWLNEHTIKFAREVTQTTHDAVIEAVKASQSVDDTIQTLMDLPEFDWRRARTTARTESIAAANAGTLEGWRQSEVVEGKIWCCAGGKRSRDTHKKADNQQKKLDEPFEVGGEPLMHPGDGSLGASAKEVCNCRCTMLSVIAKK